MIDGVSLAASLTISDTKWAKYRKKYKRRARERERIKRINLKWGTIQWQCADSVSVKYVHIMQILFNMPAPMNIKETQHRSCQRGLRTTEKKIKKFCFAFAAIITCPVPDMQLFNFHFHSFNYSILISWWPVGFIHELKRKTYLQATVFVKQLLMKSKANSYMRI